MIRRKIGISSMKDLLNLKMFSCEHFIVKKKDLIISLINKIFFFSFFIFSLGINAERMEKITKIPPKINIIKIIGNQDDEINLMQRKIITDKIDSFKEKFKGLCKFMREK